MRKKRSTYSLGPAQNCPKNQNINQYLQVSLYFPVPSFLWVSLIFLPLKSNSKCQMPSILVFSISQERF